MSIASEITRIQGAKADIKAAIEERGVTVSSSALIDEYAELIDDMPNGDEWLYPYLDNALIELKYMGFEAVESGTFQFSNAGLYYSVDACETWTALPANTNTPTVNAGDKIYFKGEMEVQTGEGEWGIGQFNSTGKFNAFGNIMSLLYGDNAYGQTSLGETQGTFLGLFSHIENGAFAGTKIVNADRLLLPATTLTPFCYMYMFSSCGYMLTPPQLPATELTNTCYGAMFYLCESLTYAPDLPATTLATQCYAEMFHRCLNLVTVPELPATTLAENCYDAMFDGCSALATAAELPATELVNGCYLHMFSGCQNLNYVKAMFTTTPSDDYTKNWLWGVAASGTFVKNSEATWENAGVIPTGWTVQTASA